MFYTILSIILFIIGGAYSFINWIIFFHNLKPNSKYSSHIPLLGGVCIYSAFWLLDMKEYGIIGLLVDYTCIPWIIIICIHRCIRKKTE